MASFSEPKEIYFDRPPSGAAFFLPVPVVGKVVPDTRWWVITSMVVSFSVSDENFFAAAKPGYLTVGYALQSDLDAKALEPDGGISAADYPFWRKRCWAWRCGPFVPRESNTGFAVPIHVVMPQNTQLIISQQNEADAELPLVVHLSGDEVW